MLTVLAMSLYTFSCHCLCLYTHTKPTSPTKRAIQTFGLVSTVCGTFRLSFVAVTALGDSDTVGRDLELRVSSVESSSVSGSVVDDTLELLRCLILLLLLEASGNSTTVCRSFRGDGLEYCSSQSSKM